jgi:tetratricopeptide (TPR) repeat protein
MPDPCASFPRRASRILVFAALIPLAGCGLRMTSPGGDVVPETPEPSGGAEVAGSTDADPPPGRISASEALVEQGQALLVAGRFEEAVAALETYLVFGEEPSHRREAAWSLALAHLLPQSPLRRPQRALVLLAEIEEGYPGTVEALQAAWLQTVLREASRNQSTLQDQQQTIQELQELVEQLKRIDLNRRPPGGR